jgi:RNA polymerase sigma-70 factor (ECF subfamily)
VSTAQDYYPQCPEAFVVSLARRGDRAAFRDLVRRRQSWLRNLMRRFCGQEALADDLAQQVFLEMWLHLRQLRKASAFGSWLRRIAVTVWLKHLRKNDALRGAGPVSGRERPTREDAGVGLDLDRALARLEQPIRLCVVLSYNEGLSHREIAELTELPLGTVKSHIRRGAEHLRRELSAYGPTPPMEVTS